MLNLQQAKGFMRKNAHSNGGLLGMIGLTFPDDETCHTEFVWSTPGPFGISESFVLVADATTTRDRGDDAAY
jgi:hypothetical protein